MIAGSGRRFSSVVVVVAVATAACIHPVQATVQAQSPIPEATRARVRALQAGRSSTEVTLMDGTRLRGRIIRTDEDAFMLMEEKTRREITLQYAEVGHVTRSRLTGNTKRAAAAAIIGGVLAVLCFAPFPIGFLCQSDPS